MTSRLTEVVVDCHDPRVVAAFWAKALGYVPIRQEEDVVEIAAWEPTVGAVQAAATPPTLLFVRVPERKQVKNRLHLDLTPIDRSRDAEVTRLLGLGARHADLGQGERSWVVLTDPEGNEFCVLRSLAPSADADIAHGAQHGRDA